MFEFYLYIIEECATLEPQRKGLPELIVGNGEYGALHLVTTSQ